MGQAALILSISLPCYVLELPKPTRDGSWRHLRFDRQSSRSADSRAMVVCRRCTAPRQPMEDGMANPARHYTALTLAAHWDVSRATVYREIERGNLR